MAKNVLTDLGANNLVNDGSTDNTAHLNAAMTAWTAADGAWFWPAGQYNFNSKPNVLPNGITWYGEGMTLTVLYGFRAAPSSTPTLDLTSTQNVTLRDMHVTTLDTANAAQQCIDATTCSNLLCERVKMSNGYSAGMRTAGKSNSLRFISGEVTNIHQDPSASGFSGDFSNSLIADTYFHDNAPGASSSTRHCIYINGTANPYNTAIRNCIFTRWAGGPPVIFKGDGTGSATGACYNLSLDGCTFDTASCVGGCASMQGAQGCSYTNNTVMMSTKSAIGFSVLGDTWNFLIDGNTIVESPADVECVGINLSGGNGGGRVSNNVIVKANGYVDSGIGLVIFGSLGNLEVFGNTFAGLYCGIYMIANTPFVLNNNGVGGIMIRDNNINIPAGAVDVSTGGVPGLGRFQTGGIIMDGQVGSVALLDNKITGMTFPVVFTTGGGFGGTGNATDIQFRAAQNTGTPAAQFTYTGGAVPTNITLLPTGSAGYAPSAAGHGFATVSF